MTTVDPLDEHRAIALARFTPKLFLTAGQLIEMGVSDEQLLLTVQMGGFSMELVPMLRGAIRHIRKQLAEKGSQ